MLILLVISVGGVLFEDVKNVDAVGLITARSGIRELVELKHNR
ncbi:MAG: hypothetical protein CM15mP58_11100 [Burkholderiaceae bacterium]|nr:MAG: hypothetical protein CM15mP58_11100 [Burkholderiaceae bacterium]